MKITFITPPSLDNQKPAERTAGCTRVVYNMPNIYELTVAALLGKEHIVVYKNFVLEEASGEDCFHFLKNDNSECYFFWSVNLSIPTDLQVQTYIHTVNPEAICIFLGPGATYFTSSFLTHRNSVVVRGEPEETVKELIELISSEKDWTEIKGISYLDENSASVIHNPPRPLIKELDSLPFPAIHFIEKFSFSNPKLGVSPYMTMFTSRNCPFKCIYCVPSSLTFAREIEYKRENNDKKPPIGFRSVENVCAEIEELAAKGYKAIGFMDDNFLVTKKRLEGIGKTLKKHNIVWGCQARADAIDEDIAQMLQEYGCKYIDLGVESFNDEILKYIKKGITSEQIYTAINLLKKYKVPVKLNILIGTSPIETEETIKDTLRRAKKLNVDQVMFNIVSPFPATEFYDLAKKNGWIEGGEYKPTDVQRNSILNYPQLTSAQMEKLLFWNNVRFFLSPCFIWRNIRKFSSLKDFGIALKALKIKLFG